ncbi:uncharacterized protein PV09_07382 [Verruconis gallopava]|uniref:Uncharacterized protein n=1 Tax=Verruconis gallopava TaxID=253628 RepID=A0A0D2A3S9_9PEZI|nr:uncharacterized protein PV09_07382 [Verruconis gallopava]KIW01095.1 hypothetical protein PV09_07382 [Verruconis gallopava]
MRLSAALVLFLPASLVLASPNPRPGPAAHAEPAAAPAPTPPAQLADAEVALMRRRAGHADKRQLTVSLFGATAILSNGVLCGGIGILTGCLGTPGTNSVGGTVAASGATVTGSGFTIAASAPSTSSDSSTSSSSSSSGDAVLVTAAPARAALAAGVGAIALRLL